MIVKFSKWLSAPLIKFEGDIEKDFKKLVLRASQNSKKIIELGGVSRPVLQKSQNYEYIGIDIDGSFVYDNYYDNFYCQSVEQKIPSKADLIFSKYLMEHVKDVKSSYLHQIEALNTNGKIIHLYPLGYHPFSMLNKLVGNKLARKIIPLIRKGTEGITGYPAYYSMGNAYVLEKFLKGQEKLRINFFYHYGAVEYFTFCAPFAVIISLFNGLARFFKIKFFASNVLVVIEKIN
jgi:hypothetical protein